MVIFFKEPRTMGRPLSPAAPLDPETRAILYWAASQKTGRVNINEFYEEQKAIDLVMSRNSLYLAMRGHPISQEIQDEIEQTLMVRGWRLDFEEEGKRQLMRRSLALFESHESYCRVCYAPCQCCGEPESKERADALIKRKFPDPREVRRDHPGLKPDHTIT
jgi:hypothetical protein